MRRIRLSRALRDDLSLIPSPVPIPDELCVDDGTAYLVEAAPFGILDEQLPGLRQAIVNAAEHAAFHDRPFPF